MTSYTIKSISWKREPYPGKWTRYIFDTPFCGLYWVIDKSADGTGFEWGYNFHDAFDCNYEECSSVEKGMELASKDWEKRLKQCLEQVCTQ